MVPAGHRPGSCVKTGQVAEAISILTSIVVEDPENVVAFTNLGIALATAGDFEAAVQQFEAALRLDPGNRAIEQNLELARDRARESQPPDRSDQ